MMQARASGNKPSRLLSKAFELLNRQKTVCRTSASGVSTQRPHRNEFLHRIVGNAISGLRQARLAIKFAGELCRGKSISWDDHTSPLRLEDAFHQIIALQFLLIETPFFLKNRTTANTRLGRELFEKFACTRSHCPERL